MTDREFKRIQAEVDEEAYQEWATRQPHYWFDQFISAAIAALILITVFAAASAMWKAL